MKIQRASQEMQRLQSPTHNLVRSSSAQNALKVKPRDIEDLKHTLYKLKIDYNQTAEENLKLKTHNT